MKNAIVKLGFSFLLMCVVVSVYAAPPTVTTFARVGPAITNATSVVFNVTFSESVTGFGAEASDVALSGAGAAGVTATVGGAGTNYTITLTGLATNGQIDVQITGAAATATAAPNDPSLAAGPVSVTFDNTPPTITSLVKRASPAQADPTTAGPVYFTVTFSDDVIGFTTADIDFTGSTTGVGTLSATNVTSVTGTSVYDIEITLSGAAVAGDVQINIPAAKVTDAAGNDNTASANAKVVYSGGTPTQNTPGVQSIVLDGAQLTGNVTAANGSSITGRGFIISTTSPVNYIAGAAANKISVGGTTGAFNSGTALDGNLTPGQHYYFVAYVEYGASSHIISSEVSFYTFSDLPSAHPTISVSVNGPTSLSVTPGGTGPITSDAGFLIVRRQGSAVPNASSGALIQDGVAPASLDYASCSCTLVANVTPSSNTVVPDPATLSPDTEYYYAIIIYNWDGSHTETINYRSGFPNDNATTYSKSSSVQYVSADATLDYKNYQDADITGAGNSAKLATFKLKDGNDSDSEHTELTQIQIKIDNYQNLRTVTIWENSQTIGEQAIVVGQDTYTFNIPAGEIEANDNSEDDFEVRATFKAVVTDTHNIKLTVMSVTAANGKSGFTSSNGGGATTPNGTNILQVNTDKLIITNVTGGSIAPGATFTATVEARDNLNNLDTDNTSNITISASVGGPLQFGGAEPATKALSSGTAVWTQLKFQFAGAKTLLAQKTSGGAATDGTYNMSIESTGVNIGIVATASLCYNSLANTAATSFSDLGNITITESDPSDFTPGTSITFTLKLPDDFYFNTAVTPTPGFTAAANITAMLPVSYPSNNAVRITMTVAGITALDQFVISGLKVKYNGFVDKAAAPILRIGGNAQIKGDDETLLKSHGTLSAVGTAPQVDFKNTNGNGIPPNETRFSSVSSPPIVLQGINFVGGADLPGVFTGPGITLGGDGKYRFHPTTLADGTYKIRFTYTNPASPNCMSFVEKDFVLYSNMINGLPQQMCDNGAPVTLTGVSPSQFPNYTCGLIGSPAFGNSQYILKGYAYYNWAGTWVTLPGTPSSTGFDPSTPAYQSIYQQSLNFGWGYGILIGFEVYDACVLGPPTSYFVWNYQFVAISKKPTISFLALPTPNICATATSVNLVSNPPVKSTSVYDDMWTSAEGAPGSLLPGIGGDVSSGFTFSPTVALNGQPNSQRVQINFRWRDDATPANSQCTNQISTVVEVFAKPSAPIASMITAKSIVGNISPEFCEREAVTAFSATPGANTRYDWYNGSGNTVLQADADIFNPYAALPKNANNEPSIGTTLFQVRRTTNVLPGFAGCQSDPLALSVKIDQPPTVNAGTTVTLCGDAILTMSNLNASITPGSGHGPLDGTWSVVSTIPPTPKGLFGNSQLTDRLFSQSTYDPSPEEVANKGFMLELESDDPDGSCLAVKSKVTVTISNPVTVTAPADFFVCPDVNDRIALSATLSGGSTGVQWSENGLGSIPADPDQLQTFYQPSSTELVLGPTIAFTVTTDDPDGSGPCQSSSDVVLVKINVRAKVDAGNKFTVCSDQTIQLNGSVPAGSSAGVLTWSNVNGVGTFDNVNLANPIYTAAASEKLSTKSLFFKLSSNDPDGPGATGPCPIETDEVEVVIHPKPAAPTTTYPDPMNRVPYCVNDGISPLSAGGNELRWYADQTLSDLKGSGPVFASGVLSNVDQEVTFWVTQTTNQSADFPSGCQSVGRPITIVVNPLPVPKFTAESFCFGDGLQLKDATTIKQPAVGTRTIDAWKWTFDDLFVLDYGAGAIPSGTHGGATSGTYNEPVHEYSSLGTYNVKLEAKSSDGCVQAITANALPVFNNQPIRIGAYPVANFSHAKICDGDQTVFTYSGTVGNEIASYSWDFGDASGSSAASPSHLFAGVNTYDVALTVTTVLGCANTVVKGVSIVPYVKTFPYIESFEGPSHGWVAQPLTNDNLNSWDLRGSTVNIPVNPQAGTNFWVTAGNSGSYFDNERSALIGPCVDVSALARPVISLDYWNDTDPRADGAYVEVSSDEGATWVRLGDAINSGLNWYNEGSIGGLAQLSGVGQTVGQFGWSGKSNTWTTAKFNLDAYANQKKLRFRVVFGSNSSQPIDGTTLNGFAMDYFKLETRNRLVLIENFTNATAQQQAANSLAFKSFPSVAAANEVVKIQYHTGFPGEDVIFTQNPMDPNARASYYGLSAAPRGYIDGYSEGTGLFTGTPWATDYYAKESLVNSPIDIQINAPTSTNGTLNITGTVKATEVPLKANEYSIYVAVVEETVASNSFVLRKMLPSAAGKKVPATPVNGTFTFNESWSIDRSNVTDPSQLRVVVFVQSDIPNAKGARQVLQAAIYKTMPTIQFTTGLELPFLEQTAMYPNPADGILHIELPEATKSGVEVKVIDQLGRPIVQASIAAGERIKSLDVSDLAGTVYMVQLKENGVYTTKRVLIRHKH